MFIAGVVFFWGSCEMTPGGFFPLRLCMTQTWQSSTGLLESFQAGSNSRIPAGPEFFKLIAPGEEGRRKRKKSSAVGRWDVERAETFGTRVLRPGPLPQGAEEGLSAGAAAEFSIRQRTSDGLCSCKSLGFSKVTLPWLTARLQPSGLVLFILSTCSFRKASCCSVWTFWGHVLSSVHLNQLYW